MPRLHVNLKGGFVQKQRDEALRPLIIQSTQLKISRTCLNVVINKLRATLFVLPPQEEQNRTLMPNRV